MSVAHIYTPQRSGPDLLSPFDSPPSVESGAVHSQTKPKGVQEQMFSPRLDTGASRDLDTNFTYLRRKLAFGGRDIQESVEIEAGVMHGNPVFRGTRIPIYQVLEELAGGIRIDELPDAYPVLSVSQIRSGLEFAASLLRIYND